MKGAITDNLITWHIQRRNAAGILRPCALVLERGTGIVVSEHCEPDAPVTGVAGLRGAAEQMGIPTTTSLGPNGVTVKILSGNIPDSTQRELEFFQLDVPCDFPGCEQLREQYKKDIESLPPKCPMCEYGAVMRKYTARMRAMLQS
jgi:hypothetical protein